MKKKEKNVHSQTRAKSEAAEAPLRARRTMSKSNTALSSFSARTTRWSDDCNRISHNSYPNSDDAPLVASSSSVAMHDCRLVCVKRSAPSSLVEPLPFEHGRSARFSPFVRLGVADLLVVFMLCSFHV